MELDKLLIGVILVSLVSMGFGVFLSDLTTTYSTPIDPAFQNTFNELNETLDLAEDITEDVKLGGVEQGDADTFDLGESVKAGINAVKSVFVQGIPRVFTMLNAMGNWIPLPLFIIRSIQAVALISIAFALIYLYFRYKNA